MNEEKALYDGRTRAAWVQELRSQGRWDLRHALAAFSLLGLPESFLDVGCGLGSIVEIAARIEIDAFGVDQIIDHESKFFEHANLAKPLNLRKQFHMVWCIEVAEHLLPSSHAILCDSLESHLMEGRGNFLVFSSAHPGQGGSGHLSERPARYWQDQFSLRHLGFREDLTVKLGLLWSNINSPLYWLPANVMVFEK